MHSKNVVWHKANCTRIDLSYHIFFVKYFKLPFDLFSIYHYLHIMKPDYAAQKYILKCLRRWPLAVRFSLIKILKIKKFFGFLAQNYGMPNRQAFLRPASIV